MAEIGIQGRMSPGVSGSGGIKATDKMPINAKYDPICALYI